MLLLNLSTYHKLQSETSAQQNQVCETTVHKIYESVQ